MNTRTRPLVSHWEVGTEGPPKLRVSLPVSPPAVRGASRWHLGFWLATYAAVFATLVGVVPAFQKMFTETGITLPAPTEVLVAVSAFAGTPLGLVLGALVMAGSVAAFRRYRQRPAVRRALVVLTLLALAYFPFAMWALFLPVFNCRSGPL
jgi:hypothetical protein